MLPFAVRAHMLVASRWMLLHVAATTKGGTYQPYYTCHIVEDRHVVTHHDDSLT